MAGGGHRREGCVGRARRRPSGRDGTVLNLARLIRAWLKAKPQHTRALPALDCLKAIGTEAALMHLGDIAHTVRFQKVQEKAEALLREVRRERSMDIRS